MKRALVLSSLLAIAACAQPMPPAPPPAPLPIGGPAPMAPPPMVSGNTFIVFFDWNRAWVSPAGMQVLQAASNQYRQLGNVTVRVTGFTDTSGSVAYNQYLSQRRARNVARELLRMGVPLGAMSISGQGEAYLRVPTPPGVREPQNRRVEIIEG